MNLLRLLPFRPGKRDVFTRTREYVPSLSAGPACVCAVKVYFPSGEKQMVSVV